MRPKLKLTEFASQFFIGMSEITHRGARECLIETCQSAGFAARILQEADAEPTAIRFVADGLGLAFMPEQVTGPSHEGVVFRPLSAAPRIDHRVARQQCFQTA